ncbi:hypothetical protein [Polaromonas sp. CG9_12]|nr:hypothetical protein [Polaromonas sp. CG9_12]
MPITSTQDRISEIYRKEVALSLHRRVTADTLAIFAEGC